MIRPLFYYCLIVVLICSCAQAELEPACPCTNRSLCAPLTTPPRPELLAFQVNSDNWRLYDWSKLTTIALFGDFDPELLCFAHEKGVRLVWNGFFNVTELPNEAKRQRYIDEMVAKTKATFTDGINVDIESAIPKGSPLVDYLSLFLREVKERYDSEIPGSQVTYDAAWSPDCIDGRCYDYLAISKSVDFLVVMDYDERSQVKSGPCIASANSPPSNLLAGMDGYMRLGIPPSKLVMGVPWYGYDYPCIAPSNETYCSIESVPFRGVNCSDAAGRQVTYGTIVNTLLPSSTGLRWDEELQSPWFNYDYHGRQHQVWFDDPRSIARKISIAKHMKLRGCAMWNADEIDYSQEEQARKMWSVLNGLFE